MRSGRRGDGLVDLVIETYAPPALPRRTAPAVRRHWRGAVVAVIGAIALTALCAASAPAHPPGPLLAGRTGSVLWFFDQNHRLNRVDLDTGDVRRFVADDGELFGMRQTIGLFRDGGIDMIDRRGVTLMKNVGFGYPVTDPDGDAFWAYGEPGANGRRMVRKYTAANPQGVEIAIDTSVVAASGDRLVVQNGVGNDAVIGLFDRSAGRNDQIATGCVAAANTNAVVWYRPCTPTGARPPLVSVVDVTNKTTVPLKINMTANTRVTISPNGRTVAAAVRIDAVTTLDVYDALTGTLLRSTQLNPYHWAWTRDSRYLIVTDPPDLIALRVSDGVRIPLQFQPLAIFGLAITG